MDLKQCFLSFHWLTLGLLNKMPHPPLILSQSDYLIQIVNINSHTEWQLIGIYTVCKGRVYPGSEGLELSKVNPVSTWIG